MTRPITVSAGGLRESVLSRARVQALLFSDRAAIAVILLLALVAFSPWWASGRVLAPLDVLHETFAPWNDGNTDIAVHNHFTSDAITQYLVYRAFAARSFARDGSVGWSDLTNAGRPEYANTMAAYDDWTMQLHRFLDFWSAWHIGLLAQLVIAACGMYMLLRAQRIFPLVALTAAIAFAASTAITHPLYHRWQLGAFCWVPWALWAMYQSVHGRRWAWPAVPVFLALSLIGGTLQTSTFVILTLLAVWLGALQERTDATARVRVTRNMVLWGAFAAALVAFSLLPAVLTYLDALDLHGDRSAPGYAHGWQQPLRALFFIPLQAVPSLLGSPRSLDLAKLFHSDLTFVAFFGFVPTLIAFRTAFWARTPHAARILILLGLLIPVTPLVGPLYHRVQILFVLGGVWAFAYYWQHSNLVPERFWRITVRALLALALCWLAASVVATIFHERIAAFAQSHVAGIVAAGGGGQLRGYAQWLQQRALQLVAELMIWHPRQLIALAAAVIGLVAVWLRQRRSLSAATFVLLAAVVVELAVVSSSWLTFADPQRHEPYPRRADIAELRGVVGDGRVYIAAMYDGPALFFPPNTLAMYEVATIQQFESIGMHGMWQTAAYATDARTLGRIGVTHAVAPHDTPTPRDWTLAVRGARFDIWTNDFALPRYVAIPAGARFPTHLDELQSGAAVAVPVMVAEASFNRRRLRVPAGVAQLRVSENWSEGWVYSVNAGARSRAARAPDGSMLVTLPQLTAPASVELRYEPRRRRIGWAISLCALALLVPTGFVVTRSDRTEAMRG